MCASWREGEPPWGWGAEMESPTASSSLLSLKGRTALVAGGGGDIGSQVSRRLLEAGAVVLSVDLEGSPGPDGVIDLECDLSDPEAVEHLAGAVERRFPKIDLLVHCAGITADAVLWKMKIEDWRRVLSVNLDSAFYLLRAMVPSLRESKEGTVVFVSSINGERGRFGQANYSSSKAGVLGLTRTAARELGRFGVRVNAISPGFIETQMTAPLSSEVHSSALSSTVLGRLGNTDDVARCVLFLCSGLSRHVTGQVLRVDGGQLIG